MPKENKKFSLVGEIHVRLFGWFLLCQFWIFVEKKSIG